MSERVFTIEEVTALIPELTRIVGAQLELQSEIERQLAGLAQLCGEVPSSLREREDDCAQVKRLKAEMRKNLHRCEAGWLQVKAKGAIVKDHRIGLLDFYGVVDGRLVWLCWRYGEESLGHYHELDAGYAGRRLLAPELKARLLN